LHQAFISVYNSVPPQKQARCFCILRHRFYSGGAAFEQSERKMKLNILRLLIVALTCVSAIVVITKAGAQKSSPAPRQLASMSSLGLPAPAQTPAPATEKTTEQVQKNIKVLNGLPQSQLIPAMNFFSASLGVRCNFCHVNNNGVWAYDSDEKPEKSTAREMIAMVLNINKTTFKGGTEVSCYTCHRGSRDPVGLPPLPLPIPSPRPSAPAGPAPGAQASPTPRPAMPSADEIINKYVAVIGGQAAIDKLKTRVMKGNINTSSGLALTYEIEQSAPDRAHEIFVSQRGTMERAVSGNMAWEKNPQGLHDITGQQLADLKMSLQLFRNLKLKEQYTSFRVGGRKEKIGDRDVYVLTGTTADKKRERLFFDAENGLLLRRISYTETMIGIIPEQTDFEDYRDVDGVKLPFTVRVSAVDAGNPVSTRTFTEIKLNVPVDDSKFNKPAARKTNP
jgi:photosynthetic reaction center cytochrome c subunit